MRVALVYDRVNKWGGAERVLLALHQIFPQAPLYASVYEPNKAGWARVFPQVVPSFLQKLSFFRDKHEYLSPLMPLAFESFSFDEYDLVISVTSEAAKGIITKPGTFHICYCLTPTRYLWGDYDLYFSSKIAKTIARPLINYLRNWDKMASSRPDAIVSISKAVRDRVKRYYNRESEVIYPPVDIEKLKTQNSKLKNSSQKSKFFLIVSRLVPYKRVDIAIAAFNRLNWPLIIIGKGSQEKKLMKMAKKNIRFMDSLTDAQLAVYYKNCQALVVTQEEDFGIAIVEAQAFGKPVIAFNAGGASEIVVSGKTGLFFEQQSPDSLEKAIVSFQKMVFDPRDCIQNASLFSKQRFKKRFLALVKNI